jgi:hypothetical protein
MKFVAVSLALLSVASATLEQDQEAGFEANNREGACCRSHKLNIDLF